MDWVQVDASIDGPHAYGYFEDVAYGGSRYVAVGQYGTDTDDYPLIMWSDDGADWHRVDAPTGEGSILWGVAYGDSMFVAVGGLRNENGLLTPVIATSPNGETWTEQDPGTGSLKGYFSLYKVAFGNGTFVAVGDYFDSGAYEYLILTSTDGETWTQQAAGVSPEPPPDETSVVSWLRDILYADGLFVAIGLDYYAREGVILTSADGETWDQEDAGINLATYETSADSIAYGSGTFVISFNKRLRADPYTNTRLMLLSDDAATWSEEDGPFTFPNGPGYLAFGDGVFVAADGIQIYSSSDALTWQEESVTANEDAAVRAVAYGDNLFVGVGEHSTNYRDPVVLTSESVSGGGWGISL